MTLSDLDFWCQKFSHLLREIPKKVKKANNRRLCVGHTKDEVKKAEGKVWTSSQDYYT